ncbi:MAG: hypothetical protein LJF15_15430 [Acidobacteria bacterium]|jgi:hypothetical protein|nr:hypothetical protein [Acidobacteriota bacterium]
MRRRPRVVATALVLALTTGCATSPTVPVFGRSVTVIPDGEGLEVKGELLAVGPDRLWVQDDDELTEVPLPEVREVRVRRHPHGAGAAFRWAALGGLTTGGALAGACSSVEGADNCGVVGLVVLGAWLLVGALAAPSMEASSRLDLWRPTPEALRPFARLPQGLPESLRPPALRPSTDDPPPER